MVTSPDSADATEIQTMTAAHCDVHAATTAPVPDALSHIIMFQSGITAEPIVIPMKR